MGGGHADEELAGHGVASRTGRFDSERAELDPSSWWSGLGEAIEVLAARAPAAYASVEAIAISAITRTQVFLDAGNAVLRPAMLWQDTRAGSLVGELKARCPVEHPETAEINDPLAKLHAICDMYLGSTRERALEFRIMHRTLIECGDEEIAAFLRSFYLDSETLLAGIIRAGQQTGVFRRNLDPRVGAWELIRTALGYTLTLPLGITTAVAVTAHTGAEVWRQTLAAGFDACATKPVDANELLELLERLL